MQCIAFPACFFPRFFQIESTYTPLLDESTEILSQMLRIWISLKVNIDRCLKLYLTVLQWKSPRYWAGSRTRRRVSFHNFSPRNLQIERPYCNVCFRILSLVQSFVYWFLHWLGCMSEHQIEYTWNSMAFCYAAWWSIAFVNLGRSQYCMYMPSFTKPFDLLITHKNVTFRSRQLRDHLD